MIFQAVILEFEWKQFRFDILLSQVVKRGQKFGNLEIWKIWNNRNISWSKYLVIPFHEISGSFLSFFCHRNSAGRLRFVQTDGGMILNVTCRPLIHP